MYEEIAPRRGGAFRSVFLIVTAGFVILSLPEWLSAYDTFFKLPYVTGVYQLLVFLVIALLIFRFLRRYSVEYTYSLVDTSVTVTEKLGARKTVVMQATLSGDSQILSSEEGKRLLREKGVRLSRVSYGVSDYRTSKTVTFPSNTASSVAVLQISDKFVEIMSQKILDKRREM